jgi:aryl-alcohol dehydrogenase-like predicted oxidoreductase
VILLRKCNEFKIVDNKIPFRKLGNSELSITPIGLGCWQFSKGKGIIGKFWPDLSDDEITEIVKVSIVNGVNWFDTAEVYGWGESEKALSRALKKLNKASDEVIIATKWSPTFRTAGSILDTIDKRIEVLNGYKIDLHQIHHPYSFSSPREEMRKMAELVNKNKIRYIGVSNFSAEKMKIVVNELSKFNLNLISNQVVYNLLNRKIETNGVMDTAKELGISVIAYSPLAQGLLTGVIHNDPNVLRNKPGIRKYLKAFKQKGLEKSIPVIELLKKFAEKYNATPSQVALNWLVNFHGYTVVAIPGATKVYQARDNANSMKFKLTDEEMHQLDSISASFK